MEAQNLVAADDLRSQKSTGILIGYILTLALMFVAFEWTQRDVKVVEEEPIYNMSVEDDMIPITQQQEVMAPPPASAPKIAEIINIVDNNTELPDQEIQTSEEVNQAITTVVGDGHPSAVSSGPVGPVVEQVDDERIYESGVEEDAQFPGGPDACMKWLSSHIKYPQLCQEQGVQGRVIVSFVVNKDGSIVDVKVLRKPDDQLADEAVRVVKTMPKWKPARMDHKPVRCRFTLPVVFRLS